LKWQYKKQQRIHLKTEDTVQTKGTTSDRYHATAVESDEHLVKCIVYIDLNMVRAGVVRHPSEYRFCGHKEIQDPPKRYAVIANKALSSLFSIDDQIDFRQEHRQWVEAELLKDVAKRKSLWSDSIAIGSKEFVENIHLQLGLRAKGRSVVIEEEGAVLKEAPTPYNTLFEGERSALRPGNSYFLDVNDVSSMG